MNKYIIIISIWLVISVITLLLFKFIPKKMKETDDKHTRNSLYSILVFIGIPFLMISILAPAVFLIGDKNMDLVYELIWGGLCMLFVAHFIVKQWTKN